jgi:hypothetical protein
LNMWLLVARPGAVRKEIEMEAQLEKEVRALILQIFGSRRGMEGVPGKDSKVPGPQGESGRNSSVVIGSVTAGEQAAASIVPQADGVHLLNLTLPRGLRGDAGPASTIPGPEGKSITGPRGPAGERGSDAAPAKDGRDGRDGRDAIVRIGSVTHGDAASASMRTINGVTYLDLVLPNAEKGERGPAGESIVGPAGKDGTSWETTSHSELSRIESMMRAMWKSDIQVALSHHWKQAHQPKESTRDAEL